MNIKANLRLWMVAAILVFFAQHLQGQILNEKTPPSFKQNSAFVVDQIHRYTQPIPISQLMDEDAITDLDKGLPKRAGLKVPVNIDFFQNAKSFTSPDGLTIWQYALGSDGALALGLVFDQFILPENGELFVYTPDKSFVVGAIGSENNNESQTLSTHIVPGDALIIEYAEMLNPGEKSMAKLHIEELIWVYNGASALTTKDLGDSDPCEININCPEGANWQTEKRGVARILFREGSSWYWCSGSLVNNTSQNASPLFLTAWHCGADASIADHNVWQFYFNYERATCANSGTPPNNMITGCQMKAMGSMSGGSDFQLVLLNQTPPLSWNPYYNGWSRSTTPSTSGVSIHHPSGDAKKISTYTSALTSASPNISGSQMATNSAWRVIWAETVTNHGVTEGGSSGSPIFNNQGLIIGTLSGGSSTCNSQTSPDYYGRFDYHWLSNGSTNAARLQPWLDPAGTNPTTLQGYDPNGSSTMNPPRNLSGYASGNSVILNWQAPASGAMVYNWFSYASDYTNLVWATPERAVKFSASNFIYSYPVTITKIGHTFYEHASYPWPSDQFRFKIYSTGNNTPLYTSPILTASHLVEIEHTLSSPLTVTGDFYVAVVPVDASGHPSSLANSVALNSTHSYYGSAGNWTIYQDETTAYELLLKVYLGYYGTKNGITENEMTEIVLETGKAQKTSVPAPLQSIAVEPGTIETKDAKATLSGYKVYRNNQLVGTINNASTLAYTNTNVGTGTYNYHVTALYSSPSGESGASNIVSVSVSNVGIEEQEESQVVLSPVPASQNLNIAYPARWEKMNVKVFNLQGQLLIEKVSEGQSNVQLDVSSLKAGVYYVVLGSEGKSVAKKFIVR